MTGRDRQEFKAYLRLMSDAQVRNIYTKENDAGRKGYADLARDEAVRRGIELE